VVEILQIYKIAVVQIKEKVNNVNLIGIVHQIKKYAQQRIGQKHGVASMYGRVVKNSEIFGDSMKWQLMQK